MPLDPKGEDENYDAGIQGGFYEIPGRIMARNMEKQPDIWWARQFSNPDNVTAHREGTGREIEEQVNNKIDAVVASIGTGGTFLRTRPSPREPFSATRRRRACRSSNGFNQA